MYQQIIDQITAKVMAGDWRADQALPSIRELAADTGTSVITVKRAYLELELAGVIYTQAGRGSFVAAASKLSKSLLHADFDKALTQLLNASAKLGLSHKQLVARVIAADPNETNQK